MTTTMDDEGAAHFLPVRRATPPPAAPGFLRTERETGGVPPRIAGLATADGCGGGKAQGGREWALGAQGGLETKEA